MRPVACDVPRNGKKATGLNPNEKAPALGTGLGSAFRMAGRSERSFVRFGNRHGPNQFLHFSQSANLSNEPQQFVKVTKAANRLDRLGHGFHLLKGNRVPVLCRLLCCGWCRYGGRGRLWFPIELVSTLWAGLGPGPFDPCVALWALLLAQSRFLDHLWSSTFGVLRLRLNDRNPYRRGNL